jgi:hypothetical protein
MMGDKTNPFRQVARLLWERVLLERKSGMRRFQSSYAEDLGELAITDTLAMRRKHPNLSDEEIALEMKKLLEVEKCLDKF